MDLFWTVGSPGVIHIDQTGLAVADVLACSQIGGTGGYTGSTPALQLSLPWQGRPEKTFVQHSFRRLFWMFASSKMRCQVGPTGHQLEQLGHPLTSSTVLARGQLLPAADTAPWPCIVTNTKVMRASACFEGKR